MSSSRTSGAADETSKPATPPAYLGLHSVDIYVRNQQRSVDFYLETLGFELAFDARVESGQRWVAVSPPDGSAVLTLIQPEPDSPQRKLIGRATRVVFVTDNVMLKYREWSERGVHFRHMPRLRRVKYEYRTMRNKTGGPEFRRIDQPPIWGAVFTRFEDVDGNTFSLVSLDEVTHSIHAQRRAKEQRRDAERRAAYELEIAREVQAKLFPQTLPPCRTLEYAGICSQARQVGGDYYDFLHLGQGRVGLVIGDISGKGIAAALLMANLQANLRSQCAMALHQPQQFLQSVNQLFYQNTSGAAYATLLFSEYDDETRRLRYVNCGHLSGLIFHRDHTIDRLDSTCTVIGLFTQWDCVVEEVQLLEGDTLVLYTDGVTESFSDDGQEFGEEGLTASIRRHGHATPQEMVTAILADLTAFSPHEQHDDTTLIVAKCIAC